MLLEEDLGQHMTPMAIADQMISLSNRIVEDWAVFDPACGDGNLLLAAIEVMKRHGISRIHEKIAGIDIDPRMVATARIRLAEAMEVSVDQVKVSCGDFFELTRANLFLDQKFDLRDYNIIISNPPYGKNREYKFFVESDELAASGTELIFLVPLAFLDRVEGPNVVPLNGRPMKVTTGHAIVHHIAGSKFSLRGIKVNQSNTTAFKVLSGVKLYEVGAGVPVQTKEIVEQKPYSSESPKAGWLPCLRTGDIHAFSYSLGRLYVKYGEHLAHPKELARFTGPRIFLRRVPIWQNRQLGAAYIEETALCAGDVLVIRHVDDDAELLRGLCAFLNAPKASEKVLSNRPSIRYRDSYPKFSAKDINLLIEQSSLSIESLRALAVSSTGHFVVSGSGGR